VTDRDREDKDVFLGKDVEEAIANGLAALNLGTQQADVEVLDEGNPGILGIGARPARVRLTPKQLPRTPEQPEEPAVAEAPEEVEAEEEQTQAEEEGAAVARAVLAELLDLMEFDAEIRSYEAPPAEDEEEGSLVLDVYGSGVSALIGRRGSTLGALQRIVRLITGRRLEERLNLVIDVEGYKERRERNLRNLAERMATTAIQEGDTVSLEPMSPYERRIVHLALRDRSDVRTESVGTGNRRRVTIIPQSRGA